MSRLRVVALCLTLALVGCVEERDVSKPATGDDKVSVATSIDAIDGNVSTPSMASSTVAPQMLDRQTIVTFTGRGDEMIDLGPGNDRFIVQAVHTGTGVFSVRARNEAFDTLAVPLFGRAGRPYRGSQVIGAEPAQIRYLEVSANGNWSVEMLTPSMLDSVSLPFNGELDQAFTYEGEGGDVRITHEGDGSFIVVTGEPGLQEVVVSVAGAYDSVDRLPRGPILVNVQSTGRWTIALDA